VDYEKLSGNKLSESSETIPARVQAARDIQNKRFTSGGSTDILCNADMRVGQIRQFCVLQTEGQSLMRSAMTQLNLSARAYHRILKLARTIADLAGSEEIQSAYSLTNHSAAERISTGMPLISNVFALASARIKALCTFTICMASCNARTSRSRTAG